MSIHFSELFLIVLVALIVIKPERLPELLQKGMRLYRWIKKIRVIKPDEYHF